MGGWVSGSEDLCERVGGRRWGMGKVSGWAGVKGLYNYVFFHFSFNLLLL